MELRCVLIWRVHQIYTFSSPPRNLCASTIDSVGSPMRRRARDATGSGPGRDLSVAVVANVRVVIAAVVELVGGHGMQSADATAQLLSRLRAFPDAFPSALMILVPKRLKN